MGNVFGPAQNNLRPVTNDPPCISFATAIELMEQPLPRDSPLLPFLADLELLKYFKCGFCLKVEGLKHCKPPTFILVENANEVPIQDLPEGVLLSQVEHIGTSCFSCAQIIFVNTLHLQNEDKSACDTVFHHAARCRSIRTLFHLICLVAQRNGSEKVLKVLSMVNDHGQTALHEAVKSGNIPMVKLLLWVAPELASVHQGTSAIYMAVAMQHNLIAKLMHDWGSSVAYTGPGGQNILHAAVMHNKDMVSNIVDWDASLLQQKDVNGNLPMHLAASTPYHHQSDLILLDEYKCAAYTSNNLGLSPLHFAVSKDEIAMIRLLIASCPDCIFFRDNSGKTMLHYAVLNRSHRTIRHVHDFWSLFSKILNIRDCDGNTALHMAVMSGDLRAVNTLLLIPDVLIDVLNKDKQTALDLAMIKCKPFHELYWVEHTDLYVKLSLKLIGAKCNTYPSRDIQRSCMPTHVNSDGEKNDSEILASSSDKLAMVSVLIASGTFASSFMLPGDMSTDTSNRGMSNLAGCPLFTALAMSNWIGFICSAAATLCIMISGMPVMKLKYRRIYAIHAHFFTRSSVTAMVTAVSLLSSISLAPASKYAAVAIWFGSPVVFLIVNLPCLRALYLTAGPLLARLRIWGGLKFARLMFLVMLRELWPLLTVLIWLAFSYRAAKTLRE